MPPSIVRPEPASDRLLSPGFGRRADTGQDRWPAPLAAAVILGLSAAGWVLLVQGARFAISLGG
jgi:hypothetical protein